MQPSPMNADVAAARVPAQAELHDLCGLVSQLVPRLVEKCLRLQIALDFGHSEGHPGWQKIRAEWAENSRAPISNHTSHLESAFSLLVISLADARMNPGPDILPELVRYVEASISAIQVPSCHQVDPNATDAVHALEDHKRALDSIPGSETVASYERWLDQVLERLRHFHADPNEDSARQLLKVTFVGFPFLKHSRQDALYSEILLAASSIQALAAKSLADRGFTIIEPLAGTDKFNPNKHRLKESHAPLSDQINAVIELGLEHNGSVIWKALVVDATPSFQTDGEVGQT